MVKVKKQVRRIVLAFTLRVLLVEKFRLCRVNPRHKVGVGTIAQERVSADVNFHCRYFIECFACADR